MCIRICSDRILSEDKQSFNISTDHLREAVRSFCTNIRIQLCIPCFFKFFKNSRFVDVLISAELVRRSTHIAGSLYIVLTTDWVNTTSRFSKFTNHHSHVRQGHNTFCTSMMLCNTKTVHNWRTISFCVNTCSFSQHICIDLTDFCYFFRCIIFDHFFHSFEVLCTVFDEFVVD